MNKKIIIPTAILSSTILNIDGTYTSQTIEATPELFKGVTSYVGHPNTAALLEDLGAVKSENPKFDGLQVGESYLAVPLYNNPRTEFHTVHQNIEGMKDLRLILVTRIA